MTSKYINEPGYRTKLLISVFHHMMSQGSTSLPNVASTLKLADKLFKEDAKDKEVIASIYFGQEGYLDLFEETVAELRKKRIRVSDEDLKKRVDEKFEEKLVTKIDTPYANEADYLKIARRILKAARTANLSVNPIILKKLIATVYADTSKNVADAVAAAKTNLSSLVDSPGKHRGKYGWDNLVKSARYVLKKDAGKPNPSLAEVWRKADELFEIIRDGGDLPASLKRELYGQSANAANPAYKQYLNRAMKKLGVRSATQEAVALADAEYEMDFAAPASSPSRAGTSLLLRGGRR